MDSLTADSSSASNNNEEFISELARSYFNSNPGRDLAALHTVQAPAEQAGTVAESFVTFFSARRWHARYHTYYME